MAPLRENLIRPRIEFVCISLAISVVVVVWIGIMRLGDGSDQEIHRPRERAEVLDRLSLSIIPAASAQPEAEVCIELKNVKEAIDRRLGTLIDAADSQPSRIRRRYVLDANRYLSGTQAGCAAVARELDAEFKRSWDLISHAPYWQDSAPGRGGEMGKERYWKPDLRDIETRNPWAVLSGCIRDIHGTGIGGFCDGAVVRDLDSYVIDNDLAREIVPRAYAAARITSGASYEYRGKSVPAGTEVVLSLERTLQSRAVGISACFTGVTSRCKELLPEALANDWHYQPGMLRAGAAAVVIVRIRDGRVVAAASGISDCVRTNLGRSATALQTERGLITPVFRPGMSDLCTQLPDSGGSLAWATVPPTLWLVGPGSTMKSLALLAGIESGTVVPERSLSFYRKLLAQSRDPDGAQAIPQRIARRSAETFSRLLAHLGFTGVQRDILFGGGAPVAWMLPPRTGFLNETFKVSEAQFSLILAAKRSGRNADAIFGRELVADYLRAQRVGISAIGSGDVRHSAWGLADWARQLVLRAEGADSMQPTHFAEIPGKRAPPVDLRFARPASVRHLIKMLSGGTSAQLGGTAAGSCRIVLGADCLPDGHPAILLAKTGTSEATEGTETERIFKRNGPGTLPAKLFMAAIRGGDGDIYAVGAMTLRIREHPSSDRPELHSNSAAELALLVAQPILKSVGK